LIIIGLDAAEPAFENHPKEIRLDSADAKFVDAIHTNGAPISSGGAGLMQISGHVDFYVNGGKTQPGCPSQISGLLSNILHFQFSCTCLFLLLLFYDFIYKSSHILHIKLYIHVQ